MNDMMSTTKEEEVIWEENESTQPLNKSGSQSTNAECDTITGISELKGNVPSIDIMPIKSGIYKIVNKVNGKYYVGSTKNARNRRLTHLYHLNKNIHKNPHLQSAWNKYGKENFYFKFIEEVFPDLLIKIEQKYLDVAKNEQNICYNLSFISDRIEMTEAVKDKIRISNARRVWSIKSLEKLSFLHKGFKHSKLSKEKIGNAHRGKIMSAESIIKRSNSRRGKYIGINNPLFGKHHSNETKQKISISRTGKCLGIENPFYGKKHTEETKSKIGRPDKIIWNFRNQFTNEMFRGTKSEFYKKYNFYKSNIYRLCDGTSRSYKGWKLTTP